MATPILTIAVLHYNNKVLTDACLDALHAQADGHDLLVIDNGSTVPYVPPFSCRLVRLPVNVGNIGGTNACYEHAAGNWVLFVANDVQLHAGCVAALWAARRTGGVVQPLLREMGGTVDNLGLRWVWPGYGLRVRQVPPGKVYVGVDAFANTCHLMERYTWQSVGGFDPTLGVSHEDVNFSLWLRRSTARDQQPRVIGACLLAEATHQGGATIAAQHTRRALSRRYHQARMQVVRQHYTGLDRWLRLAAVTLLDGVARCRLWR